MCNAEMRLTWLRIVFVFFCLVVSEEAFVEWAVVCGLWF